MKHRKAQSGLAPTHVLALALVVGLITFVGWYVWHQQFPKDLVIKEWHVKIHLTSNTRDAYYEVVPTLSNGSGTDEIHISTHKLHSLAFGIKGCGPSPDNFYLSRSEGDPSPYPQVIKKINGYNYYNPEGDAVYPACATTNETTDQFKQIAPIEKDLNNAIHNLSAE